MENQEAGTGHDILFANAQKSKCVGPTQSNSINTSSLLVHQQCLLKAWEVLN